MRLRTIVLLLSSVVLIAGCGGNGDGSDDSATTDATPGLSAKETVEQVLRRHLVASDAGDCDAVKKTVYVPALVECADVREQEGEWSADGDDPQTVPMTVEITEDSATVTVAWSDGEDQWSLENGGAGWRVLNVEISDDV